LVKLKLKTLAQSINKHLTWKPFLFQIVDGLCTIEFTFKLPTSHPNKVTPTTPVMEDPSRSKFEKVYDKDYLRLFFVVITYNHSKILLYIIWLFSLLLGFQCFR